MPTTNERDRLEIVARLNALRRLMTNVLAIMAGEERGRAQLERLLEEIEAVQDQEEDLVVDTPRPLGHGRHGRRRLRFRALIARRNQAGRPISQRHAVASTFGRGGAISARMQAAV